MGKKQKNIMKNIQTSFGVGVTTVHTEMEVVEPNGEQKVIETIDIGMLILTREGNLPEGKPTEHLYALSQSQAAEMALQILTRCSKDAVQEAASQCALPNIHVDLRDKKHGGYL